MLGFGMARGFSLNLSQGTFDSSLRLLTPADFNNAPWTRDLTMNRFSPWPLVAPVKPGETLKFDGSIAFPKFQTGLQYRQPSNDPADGARFVIDDKQDYLYIGKNAWVGPTAPGPITIKGGRNVRLIGIDGGSVANPAAKMSVIAFTKSLYMEGIRGDFTNAPEGDFMYIGGLKTNNTRDPLLPNACIQNCASKGQHGSNRDYNKIVGDIGSGKNGVPLVSVQQTGENQIAAVLAADPPGTTQPYATFVGSVAADLSGNFNQLIIESVTSGHKVGVGMLVNFTGNVANQWIEAQISGTPGGAGVYQLQKNQSASVSTRSMSARAWEFNITGSRISGVQSANGQGFNQQWDFVSYNPLTRTLVMQTSAFAGQMPNTLSGTSNTAADTSGGLVTGATLYVFNAQAGEHADFLQQGGDRQCAKIEVDRVSGHTSYCMLIFADDPEVDVSRMDYEINLFHGPMDNGSEFMRIGDQAVAPGRQRKRFYDCHAYLRPTNSLDNMAPNTSNGALIGISGGRNVLLWTRDEFEGGIFQEPVPYPKFAIFDLLGFDYAYDPTNYSGYFAPNATNMLDITFVGLSSINDNIVGGAEIGYFDVVHNLGRHSAIFNLSIIDTNVLHDQWFLEGRKCVRGKTQFDYETTPLIGGVPTAWITVRAMIEGTSHTFDKTFYFPVNDAVAPSGLTLGTTGIYRTSAVATTPTLSTTFPVAGGTLDIGPAGDNRYVLMFAAKWANASAGDAAFNPKHTLTNATDGAIDLNKIVTRKGGGSNLNGFTEAGLYIANVKHDTAATVTTGTNFATTAQGIALFRLADLNSADPFSFNSISYDAQPPTAPIVMTIDVPADGVAVLGCAYSTKTSANKRMGTAVITSVNQATYYVRVTITGTGAGPLLWEYSLDGRTYFSSLSNSSLSVTSDTAVEGIGASNTVLVAASFGPAT